jgi:hypothetical protein
MCFNLVVQYLLKTKVAWTLQKTWYITCLHQTYWSALPLHNKKIISRKTKLNYVATNDQIIDILTKK